MRAEISFRNQKTTPPMTRGHAIPVTRSPSLRGKDDQTEEKTIKPLKAADRVARKIGAMRAVTIEGVKAKIAIYRRADLLAMPIDGDHSFERDIVKDIERL